jgi:drug/metabolite transporter (DMT)-like permease
VGPRRPAGSVTACGQLCLGAPVRCRPGDGSPARCAWRAGRPRCPWAARSVELRSLPVLWCLTAAALFGASTPASKALLGESLGPLRLAGLLYLGAAVGVLPWLARGGSARLRRDARNLRRLAGAVVFGGVLGPVLLLLGLASAPSASVALWLNLETVATALLAWLLFREHVGYRTAGAAALVVAAGALLAAPGGVGTWRAVAFVAAACVCWGLDNNLTALIDGFTPPQSTFAKGLVAGTVNLSLGLVLEGPLPGAGAYGLSLVLYVAGAQQFGATRSQVLFASSPRRPTRACSWRGWCSASPRPGSRAVLRCSWRWVSGACSRRATSTSTPTRHRPTRTATATTTRTTTTSTRVSRRATATPTSTRTGP